MNTLYFFEAIKTRKPRLGVTCGFVFFMNGFGVGGVEGVGDFPLVDVLADAALVGFVADGGFALGPFDQAFEIDFVAAGNDDIGDFAVFDGPTNRLGIDAKEPGGFRDGDADDFFLWVLVFHRF